MNRLNELASIFIIFIRAGVAVRIGYSFIQTILNPDEANVYKKRIKNVLVFYIFAELIWVLKDLVTYYFT